MSREPKEGELLLMSSPPLDPEDVAHDIRLLLE